MGRVYQVMVSLSSCVRIWSTNAALVIEPQIWFSITGACARRSSWYVFCGGWVQAVRVIKRRNIRVILIFFN